MIGLINNSVSATPVINITYEALKDLKINNKLVIGQEYCITNYKIVYQRPIEIGYHDPERITVENSAKIYITASSVNKFHDEGRYYNENYNAYADIKYNFSVTTEGCTGWIWYMKDDRNNVTNYDHLNIEFARWEGSTDGEYTEFPDNGGRRVNRLTFGGDDTNNFCYNENLGKYYMFYYSLGYNNVFDVKSIELKYNDF